MIPLSFLIVVHPCLSVWLPLNPRSVLCSLIFVLTLAQAILLFTVYSPWSKIVPRRSRCVLLELGVRSSTLLTVAISNFDLFFHVPKEERDPLFYKKNEIFRYKTQILNV